MVEIIKIIEATELPLETRKEFGVFEGLVEVRLKKDSPPIIEGIKSIKGTFSDKLFKTMNDSK